MASGTHLRGGVEAANAEALSRITESEAVLVDIAPAESVIPSIGTEDVLHAGPPLEGWHEACGALRGAVIGNLLHRGLAGDPAEAELMASSNGVRLVSASEHDVLATYGGVITRDTMLFVVENAVHGTRAFSAINEGRGKALRYGSHDREALKKYSWLEGEFAETLAHAVQRHGGIDLFEIIRQALQMGDDGHSRQKAASALFANTLASSFIETRADPGPANRTMAFLTGTEIFFLPLAMAAARAAMLSAENIPHSSIVTALAGNGVRWGIRVSGTGKRWFTAPVPVIAGHYFEGCDAKDASPVIGDSEVAETMGLGAFAMSGAPALARYMGGSVAAMRELSLAMYEITCMEHPRFKLPALEYRGTPLGIDVRKVIDKGIEPVFNTGIAHKEPGVGQIGAGYGRVPMDCFRLASEALGLTRA